MNGEQHKKGTKRLCDRLESMLNDGLCFKNENEIISIIRTFNGMLYGDAIGTFVKTIKLNRKAFNKSKYKNLKPLIKKWKKKRRKSECDPEIFSDFKDDLKYFSQKHPFKLTYNGKSFLMLDYFLKVMWEPIFQENERRINLLTNRLSKKLESNSNKYKVLIDTEYELMNPFEFEEFIAELFNKMDYTTKVTSKTGDFGIDVIARKDDTVIAIQAKKYSVGNKIGNRAVQRLIGAMSYKDYKADRGILITKSDFTPQAYKQAEGNPIELWNQDYLNEITEKYFKTT